MERAKLGKRKVAPGQGSSEDDRAVHRQYEIRMRAVLERRSKHVEDMRSGKGKGLARSGTPPKARKVMYVTSDSSSEDEQPPMRTPPPAQPKIPGDR